MIWFGACIGKWSAPFVLETKPHNLLGNIVSPFFYKADQAPTYPMGIGSLLAANIIEFLIFFVFRFAFIWENKRKERVRQTMRENGEENALMLNASAFADMTDKENPNFEYIY